MTVAQNIAVILSADATSFSRGLAKAAGELKSFERTSESAARTTERSGLAAKFAAIGFGTVLATGIVAATKEAAKFEAGLRNVNTIAKLNDADLAKVGDQLLDMSTRFRDSASGLAEGMYDIQSSGFQDTADAAQVLEASATAASAGLTDTATASRVVTSALNAYGLQASDATHVSNVLFKGVDQGVMTFEEMAQSMGDAIPLAAAAGVSIEDLTGAVAAMTLTGLGAAEASTSTARMIQGLIQPSDELAKVMEELGYQSGSQALEVDGLSGVMAKLQEKSQGNIDVLLKWFPEIRAARGALALTANEGQNYADVMDEVANADANGGAAAAAYEEQMKSLSAQWDLLTNKITAVGIRGATTLFPFFSRAMELAEQFGGTLGTLATDLASRMAPGFKSLADIGSRLSGILRELWNGAKPVAAAFGAIVAGTIITAFNTLAGLAAKLAEVLERHPGLVRAIGAALATYAVAKTIAWGVELARTSTALTNMVGGARNIGPQIASSLGTAKAATQLIAEGFSTAFKQAGGGIAGLKAGIGGAGSAMSGLGSMAPVALNPVTIAIAAATAGVVAFALAWKDANDAQKAAAEGAREFGSKVQEGFADANAGAEDFRTIFNDVLSDPDTQLGKILQQDEFQQALREMGLTVDDLATALAKPGPEGQVMFAELASKAMDFDSVMESMRGSQDLSDGLQRIGAVGTQNLEDIAAAGGPAADQLAELVKQSEAAAKAAGEYAVEYEKVDTVSDAGKARIAQLKEEGALVKQVSSDNGHWIIYTNKAKADQTAVYQRTIAAMREEGIALDENGQAVTALNDKQQATIDQTGIAESKFRQMTAAQQQALVALTELEGPAAEITKKLGAFIPSTGWAAMKGELAAALPLMSDGVVSAQELDQYARSMGLSSEEAAVHFGTMADQIIAAANKIQGTFPTLGQAASAVKIPVEQLDGSIQEAQMTADNFSLEKLRQEQQRMVDEAISANESMATLLQEGQTAIVQQAETLSPELRGAFLKEVMSMDPAQRQALETEFLDQQNALAASGVKLVENNYAQLDMTTPTVASAISARNGATQVFAPPIGAPVIAEADTAAATQALGVAADPRYSTIITDADVAAAQRAIDNAASPRRTTITVDYVGGTDYTNLGGTGFRGVGTAGYGRYGGVTYMASGGIRPPVIARGGADLVHWAEPQTGREAYVPQNVSPRAALPILSTAAGWHGYRVVPAAEGYIRGGISTANVGASSATTNITVNWSPNITMNGSDMSADEIIGKLQPAAGSLGEMLRREAKAAGL